MTLVVKWLCVFSTVYIFCDISQIITDSTLSDLIHNCFECLMVMQFSCNII